MRLAWLNPAGGLRYHIRGFFSARGRWAEFNLIVGKWLSSWKPHEKKLILIGPSAGYTLPTSFLSRFDEIIAVDVDPLAPFLFGVRHREVRDRIQWVSDDFFAASRTFEENLKRWKTFLASHADSAVLFSNFLGQLRLILESRRMDDRLDRWKAEWPVSLSNRSWASYHDRLSGESNLFASRTLDSDRSLTNEELVSRFVSKTVGEVNDHRMENWFPNASRVSYGLWPLCNAYSHIIEWVSFP